MTVSADGEEVKDDKNNDKCWDSYEFDNRTY